MGISTKIAIRQRTLLIVHDQWQPGKVLWDKIGDMLWEINLK